MYIYMEASPKLRGKARKFGASYQRMAIVETKPGFIERPKMISLRAKGVKRILEDVTCHVGTTPASYGYKIRRDMVELVGVLNEIEATLGVTLVGE